MKNLLISMLFLSCLGMMYGKIFVKPEQYHYVQDRGYLSPKEFKSFNRAFQAKDIADEFDKQIDLWYDKAREEITKDEINRAMEDQVYEQTNYLKLIDHYPVNSVSRGSSYFI